MKVAVIPARGGSQRIPSKNIRSFHGKPVIAYSIEAAGMSGLFDRIIVSTDDHEIADVAVTCGAEVPFVRPARLADGATGTSAVVKHALQWLQEHDTNVEYACCIYATAPFLTVQDLQEGYRLLQDSARQYAFSVTSFPFPVQRAIRIAEAGGVEPMFPQYIACRSQDLEEAYHDAGQFYWGRAEAFLNDVELFSDASIPVVLPRHRVQDIDTPEDWVRAELMFQALQAD
jgi:pseudaminic acid cytidylyltransferase